MLVKAAVVCESPGGPFDLLLLLPSGGCIQHSLLAHLVVRREVIAGAILDHTLDITCV